MTWTLVAQITVLVVVAGWVASIRSDPALNGSVTLTQIINRALEAREETGDDGRPLSRREIVEVWHDVLMGEADE